DDDAAHRQHLVDIEKIDKHIVECVLAVQESKVDLLVPGKQLRETLERGFLIELDAIVISGSLEIGEADAFKSGVRTSSIWKVLPGINQYMFGAVVFAQRLTDIKARNAIGAADL